MIVLLSGEAGTTSVAEYVATLGIEPRASRMLSGCDTTTPCAHDSACDHLIYKQIYCLRASSISALQPRLWGKLIWANSLAAHDCASNYFRLSRCAPPSDLVGESRLGLGAMIWGIEHVGLPRRG